MRLVWFVLLVVSLTCLAYQISEGDAVFAAVAAVGTTISVYGLVKSP